MTTVASIRELTRNSALLSEYDYVEIEDQKSHQLKGLFISPKYADEIKMFLDEKLDKERSEKLKKLKKYAGKGKIEPQYDGLSNTQLQTKIADNKLHEE